VTKCAIRTCRAEFVKRSMTHKCCSAECAHRFVIVEREKAQEKELLERNRAIRVRKTAVKSLAELAKDAQTYVNRYARLRDYHKGCCSCDKPSTWDGQWHASHYISVGASSALRFHLWNLNKSCSSCNEKKSGNIVEYGLRMDPAKKEFLDNHPRGRKFTREYLLRLKSIFAKRCRILEKRLKRSVAGASWLM